jgi:CRP-like cAMP-binding protein/small-conductance mechanosensitive channel
MNWEGLWQELRTMAGLLGALIIVAALVNRFAPERRGKLRRLVILFVLGVGAGLASSALSFADSPRWHNAALFVEKLLETFLFINLVVVALFDVLLRVLSLPMPAIAGELVAGAGYVIATLGALHGAGLNPASVLGASAVVSTVLAFSLQSTLGNVIGGVAIQLDGSVNVGDWIQLENGRQGRVREIRWRHSVLETRDWGRLIVPNATLLQSQILVLGKREGRPDQHRFWVYFNVDFRYPPARVIAVVDEALHEGPIPHVAGEPRPHTICLDLSRDGKESFGYYAVRYWLTDLAVDDPTNSLIRQRIYTALRRAGIPLARPVSTSFMLPEEPIEERQARHRDSREKALRGLALFAPLTDEERALLAEHLIFAPFTAGEYITRRGKVAHFLYILVSGTVEIRLTDEGTTRTLAKLEAPAFFGEMGMMTGEPRAADVVATAEVECYRLDKSGFEEIILARPELAREMSAAMAERRAEMKAVREGLAGEQRARFLREEQTRLIGRIEDFFGLR